MDKDYKLSHLVGLCSIESLKLESFLEFIEYLTHLGNYFPQLKITVLHNTIPEDAKYKGLINFISSVAPNNLEFISVQE